MANERNIDYGSVLNDFITTVRENPNATDDELLGAFQEFNGDRNLLDAAFAYKENVDANKYDDATLKSKFPEFFGQPAAPATTAQTTTPTAQVQAQAQAAPTQSAYPLLNPISSEEQARLLNESMGNATPRIDTPSQAHATTLSEQDEQRLAEANAPLHEENKAYEASRPQLQEKWEKSGDKDAFEELVAQAEQNARQAYNDEMKKPQVAAHGMNPFAMANKRASEINDPAAIISNMEQIISDRTGNEEAPTDSELMSSLNMPKDEFTRYMRYAREKMEDYFIEKNLPTDKLDYFVRKVVMGNPITQFATMDAIPLSQRQFSQQAMDQYSQKNGTFMTDIAAEMAIVGSDPLMWMSAGIGGAAERGFLWGVGKIGGKFIKGIPTKIGGRYLTQSYMLRNAAHMVHSGAMFSSLDMGHSAIGQLYSAGELNMEEVGKSGIKGFGTGLAFGLMPVLGTKIQGKVAQRYGQTLGAVAGQSTNFMTGVALLTGSSIADQIANGVELKDIKWGEEIAHNVMMQTFFTIHGSFKGFSMRNLRKTWDAMKDDVRDASFNKDDVAQLNAAGYKGTNFLDIVKNLGIEDMTPENVNAKMDEIIANPLITTQTKNKLFGIMTGKKIDGAMPLYASDPIQQEDGKYVVIEVDNAGLDYSRKVFDTERAAQEYSERMTSKDKQYLLAHLESITATRGMVQVMKEITDETIDRYLENYPGDTREEAIRIMHADKSTLSKIELVKRNTMEEYLLKTEVKGADAIQTIRQKVAYQLDISVERLNDIVHNASTKTTRDYIELSREDKGIYDAYIEELKKQLPKAEDGTKSIGGGNGGAGGAAPVVNENERELQKEASVDDNTIYAVRVIGEDGEYRIKSGAHVEDGRIVPNSEDAIITLYQEINGEEKYRQVRAAELELLADPVRVEEATSVLNEMGNKPEQVQYEKDGEVFTFERNEDGTFVPIDEDGNRIESERFNETDLDGLGYHYVEPTTEATAERVPVEPAEPEATNPIVTATDTFVSKHGDKASAKLDVTIKSVEKDLADADKVLKAAQKKYDELPEAYNAELEKKEQKALQDVQSAQAKYDKLQSILDRYNGIKDELIKRSQAQEPANAEPQPATEEVVAENATTAFGPYNATDNNGNPIDSNGKLITEKIKTIDEISDSDFEMPSRSVELPKISENLASAIDTGGRPVIIKKSIFEKNLDNHPELDPEDNRNILKRALYGTNMYGSTQPIRRPYYRVAIQTGDNDNAVVVLDVYKDKYNVEIVGWRKVDEKGLQKLKKQSEREDGQLLILSPISDGSAAALSTLPPDVSKSEHKVTENNSKKQISEEENAKKIENSLENGKKEEIVNSKSAFTIDELLAEIERQFKEGDDSMVGYSVFDKGNPTVFEDVVDGENVILTRKEDGYTISSEHGRFDDIILPKDATLNEVLDAVKEGVRLTGEKIEAISKGEDPAEQQNEKIDKLIAEGSKFSFTYGDGNKRRVYVAEKGHHQQVITKSEFDYAKEHGGKILSDAEAKDIDEYAEYNRLSDWWFKNYAPIGSGRDLDKTIESIEKGNDELAKKDLPSMKRLKELRGKEREIRRRLETYEEKTEQDPASNIENGLEEMENTISAFNYMFAHEDGKAITQENLDKVIQFKNQLLEADNIIQQVGWGNVNKDELHRKSTEVLNKMNEYIETSQKVLSQPAEQPKDIHDRPWVATGNWMDKKYEEVKADPKYQDRILIIGTGADEDGYSILGDDVRAVVNSEYIDDYSQQNVNNIAVVKKGKLDKLLQELIANGHKIALVKKNGEIVNSTAEQPAEQPKETPKKEPKSIKQTLKENAKKAEEKKSKEQPKQKYNVQPDKTNAITEIRRVQAITDEAERKAETEKLQTSCIVPSTAELHDFHEVVGSIEFRDILNGNDAEKWTKEKIRNLSPSRYAGLKKLADKYPYIANNKDVKAEIELRENASPALLEFLSNFQDYIGKEYDEHKNNHNIDYLADLIEKMTPEERAIAVKRGGYTAEVAARAAREKAEEARAPQDVTVKLPVERVSVKPAKVSSEDLSKIDGEHAALAGILYKDGYAYSSDGYTLLKVKSEYPQELEGKIKVSDKNREKHNKISGKDVYKIPANGIADVPHPAYEGVINAGKSGAQEFSVDVNDLRSFVAGIREILKQDVLDSKAYGEKGHNIGDLVEKTIVIIRDKHGLTHAIPLDRLGQFADMMEAVGAKSIMYKTQHAPGVTELNSAMLADGENGTVVVMPLYNRSEVQDGHDAKSYWDLDGVYRRFYYDLNDGAAPTPTPSGTEPTKERLSIGEMAKRGAKKTRKPKAEAKADAIPQDKAPETAAESIEQRTVPVDKADVPSEKLDDFGEKIYGARKDMMHEIAKSFDNVTIKALVEQPLSKVYKKQSVEKLVKNGVISEKYAPYVEAMNQVMLSVDKPRPNKDKDCIFKYRNNGKTRVEAYAEAMYERIQEMKRFLEATDEERDNILAGVKKYKDEEGERAGFSMMEIYRYVRNKETGEMERVEVTPKDFVYTPDPMYVYTEILNRLGYRSDNPVELFVVNIKSNGTDYSVSRNGGTYIGANMSGSSVEEIIDNIEYATRVINGMTDFEIPTKYIRMKSERRKFEETGKWELTTWSNRNRINRQEFDTEAEANEFYEKVKAGKIAGLKDVVKPTKQTDGVNTDYVFYIVDPKSGEVIPFREKKFDTKEEASAYLNQNYDEVNKGLVDANAKAKGVDTRTEKSLLSIDYVYHGSGIGYAYEISYSYGKDPWERHTIKGGFKNRDEAVKYYNEHKEELEKPIQEYLDWKKNFTYFNPDFPRIGEDYRKGKDATPEMYNDTFGFRGVQFGNWTNARDRQNALNEAYDAFMDMSRILGISPKAVSLNGELGLAFGARGSGKALAHYESNNVVINLTKTKGAGSLAHEWMHALDNYFARLDEMPGAFVTSVRNTPNMRPELRDAWDELMDAVSRSEYGKRSRLSGQYWGSPWEMAARLFELYTYDTLGANGERNTFLGRGVENGAFDRIRERNYFMYEMSMRRRYEDVTDPEVLDNAIKNGGEFELKNGRKATIMSHDEYMKSPQSLGKFPEATPEERAVLNPLMKNLFDTMQERVDEETGKVALYSRGDSQGVEQYEGRELTEAEQLATDGVMAALDEAGVTVNRISNEEADEMGEDGVQFMAMSETKEDFDRKRQLAIDDTGIVAPNLADMQFDVVDVSPIDFSGSKKQKAEIAEDRAKNSIIGSYLHPDGFEYTISRQSIEKMTNHTAYDKSKNEDLHFAVLLALPDVINASHDVEIHADYAKTEEGRSAKSDINEDLLIHRFYGAVNIGGETCRVKTTIREFKDKNKTSKPYSFEVSEVEIISSSSEGLATDARMSKPEISISGAKLLKNVEKSKDFGKKLLDFSKKMQNSGENEQISWQKVGNRSEIERLDNEPTIKLYRSMQTFPERPGEFFPPMAAVVNGEMQGQKIGEWYKADEHPELLIPNIGKDGVQKTYDGKADNAGKPNYKFRLNKGESQVEGKKMTTVDAAYNPYFHSSTTMLNDQFAQAVDRPNMVTVEVEVPERELKGEYSAEYAKDHTGMHEWKAGPVQGKLTGTRQVMLSQYCKIVRVVPNEEVAKSIAKQLEGSDVAIPFNVLPPALRTELEKIGVPISENDTRAGVQKGRALQEVSTGRVYGWTQNGEITLAERGMNPNTPVHEYSHLWTVAVRKNNPELWQSVKDVFKDNPLVDKVRKDENYQGLDEDGVIDEVVARYSGKRGAERLTNDAKKLIEEQPTIKGKALVQKFVNKVREAISKLWDWIGKDLFKLKKFGSPEEVADRILYDLYNGTNLNPPKQGEARYQISTDPTWRDVANDVAGGKRETNPLNGQRLSIRESIMDNVIGAAVKEGNGSFQLTERAVRSIDANIKDLRKAMRLQKINDRDAVNTLATMAKIFIKNGWFTDASRTDLYEAIDAISGAVGNEKNLKPQINRLMMAVTDAHLSHLEDSFNKMRKTQASKTSIAGNNEQAKLDIEAQHRMRAFNSAIDLGYEGHKVSELMSDAMDNYVEAVKANDESKIRQYEQEVNGYAMAQEYIDHIRSKKQNESELLRALHEAKRMDMRGSEHPILAKRQMIQELQDAIIATRLEIADAYRRLNSSVSSSVLTGKMKAAMKRDEQFQHAMELRHFVNSDLQGVGGEEGRNIHHKDKIKQKVMNSPLMAGGMFQPMQDLNSMLKSLAPKAPDGRGYLWDHFMRNYIDASDAEFKGVKSLLQEVDHKVSEIFGQRKDFFGRSHDISLRDMAESVNKKSGSRKVTFLDKSGEREVELTQGQLAYLYAMEKQTDGRMKLRAMGITEEQMREISTKLLDPKVREFMDWVQGEFLVRTRDRYNKEHERLFGAPMEENENYFPIVIAKAARGSQERIDENTDGIGYLSGTTTGAIINRTRNTLPIDILNADAFSILVDHILEMEHWHAFAAFNRDANIVLSYSELKTRMNHMTTMYGAGEQLHKNLKDAFRLAVGTYQPKGADSAADKFLLNMAKLVATSKVTFHVWTAAKQVLSLPAFATECADDEFMTAFMNNIVRPIETYNWAMENIPTFAKRVESRKAGDPRLEDTQYDYAFWHNKVVEAITKTGMAPNAYVDALTIAVGAKAHYEAKLKKYKDMGMSDEAADARAKFEAANIFNETQQSSEGPYVSRTQKDMTWTAIGRTVFQNAVIAYMKRFYQHGKELVNNIMKKDEQIEYLTKKYTRMGVDEDKAKEYAKKEHRRETVRNIIGVITFGYVMQAVWRLGSNGFYLAFGKDNEEKERMVDDALLSAGSFVGPIRGTLIGKGLEAALDGRGWYNATLTAMPFEEDVMKISNEAKYGQYNALVTDMVNLLISAGVGANPQTIADVLTACDDAFDGNMDDTREFVMLLGRALCVPESQMRKIYIDEFGATADEVRKTFENNPEKAAELVERYARYKVDKQNYDLVEGLMSEESKRKEIIKESKKLRNSIKERVRNDENE